MAKLQLSLANAADAAILSGGLWLAIATATAIQRAIRTSPTTFEVA